VQKRMTGWLMGVGALTLAACADSAVPTSAPTRATSGATRSISSASSSLIQILDIKLARGGPGTIDPCWLINRGIYIADQQTDRFDAVFAFTYMSRGEVVTQTFTVNVRDGREEEDERNVDAQNFIEVTNSLNIGDMIPDAGDIIGSVTLIKSSGGTRSIIGGSTITVRQ
jgi:hypothetical protein